MYRCARLHRGIIYASARARALITFSHRDRVQIFLLSPRWYNMFYRSDAREESLSSDEEARRYYFMRATGRRHARIVRGDVAYEELIAFLSLFINHCEHAHYATGRPVLPPTEKIARG